MSPRTPHRPSFTALAAFATAVVFALLGQAVVQGANEATVEVVGDAAIRDSHGLRVTVDGRSGPDQRAFVIDATPAGEVAYRALFWLDPRRLTLGPGNSFVLFEGLARDASGTGPARPAFRVHLRKGKRFAPPTLVGELFAADRSSTTSQVIPLPGSRAPHRLRVEWRAATAGAADGLLRLSLLGEKPASATAPPVANAGHRLQSIRLGAIAGVDAGTFGSFDLDGFESYRTLEP
jgi:hypothetical protein